MKARWRRLLKAMDGRTTGIGALVFCGILLTALGILGCSTYAEKGKFLAAVAIGIVISVVLRIALNFDPEE